jgi:hypothetical protein
MADESLPLGLGTPVLVGGDLDLTEGIGFGTSSGRLRGGQSRWFECRHRKAIPDPKDQSWSRRDLSSVGGHTILTVVPKALLLEKEERDWKRGN